MTDKCGNDFDEISQVIQGPIKSYGIDYKSDFKYEFNSFNRVIKNITEFKKYSNNIVLSTYIGELSNEQLYSFDCLKVKVIQEKKMDLLLAKDR